MSCSTWDMAVSIIPRVHPCGQLEFIIRRECMIWGSLSCGCEEFYLLGFKRRVVCWKSTDDSEERLCLQPDFMLVSCLAYSSTLEATWLSTTIILFTFATNRLQKEDWLLSKFRVVQVAQFVFVCSVISRNWKKLLILAYQLRKIIVKKTPEILQWTQ
jgi:hypothetical protein